MSRVRIAAFVMLASTAHAEVYRCPPTYPDQSYPVKDVPNAPLTGAEIMFGERPSSGPPYPDGWITPDEIPREGGMDFQYWLSENEHGWLICTYGARKRINGRFHGGKEWGQYMESGQPWFVRLPPRIKGCTVKVRETKIRDPSKSTWTVTANCTRQP